MAIPYTSSLQSVYDTPRTSQCWVEYPFAYANDNTTRLYHHLMIMPGDKYAPLSYNDTMAGANKPLDSLFADDANAFWVEDRNLAPIGNNLVSFDRLFAQVPTARIEGAPNYSFSFPSNGNTTINSEFTVSGGTSVTRSIVNGRPEVSFTTNATNALMLGIGDKFTLASNNYGRNWFKAIPYGSTTLLTFGARLVVYSKTPSGSNYTIKGYVEGHEGFILSSWQFPTAAGATTWYIQRITLQGRDGTTSVNASSTIDFRYIKTDDINSQKLGTEFQVILAPHSASNPIVVEDLSASTYPNLSMYNGLVYRGASIAAEDESARRWLGNIWEFQSRRVRAS